PPGKQAQVDWGQLVSLAEGSDERKLWGFTITLGYSRMMMAEAATDQKLGTLLRMHETAFRQWGAVPAEILYDRMKTIWTGADERKDRVGSEIRQAEFSVRTAGAGTGQSRRLQCRVAQMGSRGCQSARARHDTRGG